MNFSKSIFLAILIFSFYACNQHHTNHSPIKIKKAIIIDSIEVAKNELVLNQLEGKWYYNNQPFNGFSVKLYDNGNIEERLGFYKGKRQGIAKRWSPNGVLRVQSYYNQNKLVGVYKSWWENGTLSEQSFYKKGLKNGLEKQWHPSGQLAKQRKLVNNKEVGLQQAWLNNGTLYVNYEAKNGRIFGMKKANLCYQLKDEVVQN